MNRDTQTENKQLATFFAALLADIVAADDTVGDPRISDKALAESIRAERIDRARNLLLTQDGEDEQEWWERMKSKASKEIES